MTPTREQIEAEVFDCAEALSAVVNSIDGDYCEHHTAPAAQVVVERLRKLAACLAAPPQATPEPQAMPPIEPDDWVELEQWPNCEWVVLSVDSDGRVSLIGLDLRYRIRDVIGISKANGTVWTREPRR